MPLQKQMEMEFHFYFRLQTLLTEFHRPCNPLLVVLCGAVLCGKCFMAWQHVQQNGQRVLGDRTPYISSAPVTSRVSHRGP